QDYIPVSGVEESWLMLQEPTPHLRALGFVPAQSVPRHHSVAETHVVLPEPGSGRSGRAISSLVRAMRNLEQVFFCR
ncbi:unnamed protein product, partial [Discosporangium mesarthrocarpum]